MWRDSSFETHPFICQQRLRSKKHKEQKLLLHLLHIVNLNPTGKHLQTDVRKQFNVQSFITLWKLHCAILWTPAHHTRN